MIGIIIYLLVFVMLFIMTFNCLRQIRLERIFNQGKVFEIRFAYIVFSLCISYLLCELIWKLLSFSGINL